MIKNLILFAAKIKDRIKSIVNAFCTFYEIKSSSTVTRMVPVTGEFLMERETESVSSVSLVISHQCLAPDKNIYTYIPPDYLSYSSKADQEYLAVSLVLFPLIQNSARLLESFRKQYLKQDDIGLLVILLKEYDVTRSFLSDWDFSIQTIMTVKEGKVGSGGTTDFTIKKDSALYNSSNSLKRILLEEIESVDSFLNQFELELKHNNCQDEQPQIHQVSARQAETEQIIYTIEETEPVLPPKRELKVSSSITRKNETREEFRGEQWLQSVLHSIWHLFNKVLKPTTKIGIEPQLVTASVYTNIQKLHDRRVYHLTLQETTLSLPTGEGVGFDDLHSQIKSITENITLIRRIGHAILVLSVGIVVFMISHMQLPERSATVIEDSKQRTTLPITVIESQEKQRTEIKVYTVKPGDTTLGIADQFGLQPETIIWANEVLETNPDRLIVGEQLNILPFDGVLHVVKPGDTLSGLATEYKVEIEKITDYAPNGLLDASSTLKIGSQIVIPGGTKPFFIPQVNPQVDVPEDAIKGTGSFSWPTSGNITQQFWGAHRAIDIGSWEGAPVKAADSGYVVFAGGYSNYVIIDHGNGFITLYAHLNSIFVRPSDNVTRGEQIGTMGNVGNSTGPHLHFEIRYRGVPLNPYTLLP